MELQARLQTRCPSPAPNKKQRGSSADKLLPAFADEFAKPVDVLGYDIPIHHRTRLRRAACRVGNIGPADRKRGTEDHPKNQTHGLFPLWLCHSVGCEHGTIVVPRISGAILSLTFVEPAKHVTWPEERRESPLENQYNLLTVLRIKSVL